MIDAQFVLWLSVIQQHARLVEVLARKVSQDQIAFQIELGFFFVGDGLVGNQSVDVPQQVADADGFGIIAFGSDIPDERRLAGRVADAEQFDVFRVIQYGQPDGVGITVREPGVTSTLYIGMISGTSRDGVDAALVSFEDGQISSRYPAPFSVYQQLQGEQRKVSQSSPTAIPRKREEKSRSTKLTWKKQRELERLETQVETLEAQKTILHAKINSSGSDYVRLQALAEQLQTLEAELETMLTRWFELSELGGKK